MSFSSVTITSLLNKGGLSRLLAMFYVPLEESKYPEVGKRCFKRITFKG